MQVDCEILPNKIKGPDKFYYGLHGSEILYMTYQPLPRLQDMEHGLMQTLILPGTILCIGFHKWNAEFVSVAGKIGPRCYGYNNLTEAEFMMNLNLAIKLLYTDIFKHREIVEYIELDVLKTPIPTEMEGFLPLVDIRQYRSNKEKDLRDEAYYELKESIRFNSNNSISKTRW